MALIVSGVLPSHLSCFSITNFLIIFFSISLKSLLKRCFVSSVILSLNFSAAPTLTSLSAANLSNLPFTKLATSIRGDKYSSIASAFSKTRDDSKKPNFSFPHAS